MSALPDEEYPVAADSAARSKTTEGEGSSNLHVLPGIDLESAGPGPLQKALQDLRPPQFWEEPTPSPAEELNRARHGRHLQASGPLRRAAIGYGYLAGVVNVKAKAAIWVRSHPMRALTAVVLVGLLCLTPARTAVAWVLFGVEHLLFEAMTD